VHCALWAKSGQAQPIAIVSMGLQPTGEVGELAPHGGAVAPVESGVPEVAAGRGRC
jgi:hypothetical protein